MAWQRKLEGIAKEGLRSYEVAKGVAADYGALAATVMSVKYGGVTFLVASVLSPAGLVLALVLIPLWPWIFVLPALLMALALAAAVFTAFMLFVQLPKRARGLLATARRAGDHALGRYEELRALAEDKGWLGARNGNGAAPAPARPLVTHRADAS